MAERNLLKRCRVCGVLHRRWSARRCSSCEQVARRHPCVDCGKVDVSYNAERCNACHGRQMVGAGHPGWGGGRHLNSSGYWHVWIPDDDPMASMRQGRTCEVPEHRLVMARHLGRPLATDEVVHHINHDKQDNRIENLELTDPASHMATHRAEVPLKPLVVLTCEACGSDFTRPQFMVNSAKRKGSRHVYCSRPCFLSVGSRRQ